MNKIVFEIKAIANPKKFLEQIQNAYSVKELTVEISLPNLFNVKNDFEQPLAKYIQEIKGEKGQAIIKGEDLNRDIIGKTTKSATNKGNEVKAKIVEEQNSKQISISTRKSVIIRDLDESISNDIDKVINIMKKLLENFNHE